jgi:lipid-A-disaccharide synthase
MLQRQLGSYQIAKRIITLKFSLVNLIMDEEVVTELIQENAPQNALEKN